MNRHFYNFVAAFNAASKTRKFTMIAPIRNKFLITFLDFLLKERLIDSYYFPKGAPKFGQTGVTVPLGSKASPYFIPVEITLKSEVVKKIYSVSTPGKYFYMSKRRLAQYAEKRIGSRGVVVVSSPRLRRLCNAKELIPLSEGGLVVCVVFIS